MEITSNLIQDLETQISNGELGKVIQKLLEIKDKTKYRSEILGINSRWKKYSSDQIKGTLSDEQSTLQNSKLNNDLIILLEALQGELNGEKVIQNLISDTAIPRKQNSFLKTYLPIILTALGVWTICFFAYRQPTKRCEEKVEIGGAWDIVNTLNNEEKKMGSVNIEMEICSPNFEISGLVKSSTEATSETDFNSKIGMINDGVIIFVYENFLGEMGVCRGVVPAEDQTEFTVHCIDLIGLDKNNQSKTEMKFRKRK